MMNIATTPASTAHTRKTIDIATMTWREKARVLKTALLKFLSIGFSQIDKKQTLPANDEVVAAVQ
jgi:hypothetical protein